MRSRAWPAASWAFSCACPATSWALSLACAVAPWSDNVLSLLDPSFGCSDPGRACRCGVRKHRPVGVGPRRRNAGLAVRSEREAHVGPHCRVVAEAGLAPGVLVAAAGDLQAADERVVQPVAELGVGVHPAAVAGAVAVHGAERVDPAAVARQPRHDAQLGRVVALVVAVAQGAGARLRERADLALARLVGGRVEVADEHRRRGGARRAGEGRDDELERDDLDLLGLGRDRRGPRGEVEAVLVEVDGGVALGPRQARHARQRGQRRAGGDQDAQAPHGRAAGRRRRVVLVDEPERAELLAPGPMRAGPHLLQGDRVGSAARQRGGLLGHRADPARDVPGEHDGHGLGSCPGRAGPIPTASLGHVAAASADTALKRTPLYDRHVAAGAKLVPFAGWEMPVQYDGVKAEHLATRATAGVFDVSHMGEIATSGPDAEAFLQRILSNDVSKLQTGGAQYALLCRSDGGVLDDLFTYRLGADQFLTVTNASNHAKDYAWFAKQAEGFDVTVTDAHDQYAMLAVQ